jgi:hypothetical protein
MIELSSSDFGSGYFNSEKIGTLSHHVRLKGELRNWELDSIAWGLQMAAISIKMCNRLCVQLTAAILKLNLLRQVLQILMDGEVLPQ